jgi:hypothetical protein
MKRPTGLVVRCLLVSFCVCLIPAAAEAQPVTLVGEINDSYQLVADGQIFEIDDTDAGNDLVENYVSQKVKVTGIVREEGDAKIITVQSFETAPE